MIVYAILNPNEWEGQFELLKQLKADGREEEIKRLGLKDMETLPDWISYHNAAESMHCPPWELFEAHETPPPKWWWRETRMILDHARAEARKHEADARAH